MEKDKLPENMILVTLSPYEPKISYELKKVNEQISNQKDCDVIIDFTYVEIINSSNISNLLILRSFLEDNGRRLLLHNVQTITKCIFVVAGLTEVFEFVDDLEEARTLLQTIAR